MIRSNRWIRFLGWMAAFGVALAAPDAARGADPPATGSAIFLHPDGTGPQGWTAHRIYRHGPDGRSHWDRMERIGLYRSHVLNSTNASSHGGATVHAYGVKVPFDTYGHCPEKPVLSLSGKHQSIMIEAREAGLAIGLVNSGHLCEPGTGVFVAGVPSRAMSEEIARQVVESGAEVLFAGGEIYLLPDGHAGRHGSPGVRKDGRNLIEEAQRNGYRIVYTREELLALPSNVERVLGIFAARHTFHAAPEEELAAGGLPFYEPDAPTLAEMTAAALRILETKGRRFLLVVEEEGTDNFANSNNASGTLEALRRADDAIGVALDYLQRNPETLLITAADSDAGGFQIRAVRDSTEFDQPLPRTARNGAPYDGVSGPESAPFVAAPDRHGTRLRFGVVWACHDDVAGGITARAHGLNAELLRPDVDNTDIYRILYATLFGRWLGENPEHMR